ncbi:MAG: hypothetical protein E7148_03575 [Rikenellaceae bacterium]|nr:hypothetical protein [Rikenellaceae bacterium]
MKKKLIYLLCPILLASVLFTACSNDDDLSATSVIRETTTEENDLDRWLQHYYMLPYNIQFKYRFEDIESSMEYYLTPASYEKSVAMAKLVRHMCLEVYDELTGSCEFIKAYFPKVLCLVGSYAYKTNGSVVLGTAEAGAKITLYNLDNLNTSTVNSKTAYFKTIHHEFGHILNQTKPYSTDFPKISGDKYVQDDCFDVYDDTSSLKDGFITAYASNSAGEDFVEIVSIYVTRTAEEWEEKMVTAGTSGREIIESKLTIVKSYMENSWNINLDDMRAVILRRASEAPHLNFSDLTIEAE